ncbi:MAG: hypothetical protein QOJ16_4174 [Acidobacteriota bacterium]|jgi:hypothetical protein|nr:hypothetical protein [Acidobacteriota bacterium]
MHDLDRTLQALEPEGEYGAGEYELAPEIFGNGGNGGNGATAHGELSPQAELELANELFAATSEGELEQFISSFNRYYPKLQRRGRYRVRRFFRRYLQGGGYRGYRDGYGGGYAGGYTGGMEPPPPPPPPLAVVEAEPEPDPDGGGEELEFSSAQRFVRLGSTLAKKLMETSAPAQGDTEAEAGFQQSGARPAAAPGSPSRKGRWERRHGKIVLFGT